MSTQKLSALVLDSSASEPASTAGIIYFDDGTNTASGDPAFRQYDGNEYKDITNGEIEVGIVVDRKANGTVGGSYTTANTDQTRTINTTIQSQSWLSISSNQITIDGANYPGRYLIEWIGKSFRVDRWIEFLEDQSGPTIVSDGMNSYSVNASLTSSNSTLGYYEVDITTSKTYEIVHIASNNSFNTNGMGVTHSLNTPDPETYCTVYITRFPT